MSLAAKNIFVTGGLGFIGSHTVLTLLEHGATVHLIDNLSNSFPRVWDHMKKLAGDKADKMKYTECDINDKEGLTKIFDAETFDCVIHFAGFKAVGESVDKPLEYYRNNFVGTVVLLEVMRAHGLKNVRRVEYKILDRRAGDSVAVWAATETAEKELGWKSKYNVDDMCKHQWAWASKYPQGYETPL
ncbi:UDP-glucose 4-epimerase 3 [Tetrabaena socialis]|uniref:UDP-glucose 4-epimerase n=1 Tax=Tetrabaena socialis TaxID=47790 RepID=A0A2J7ZNM7_9CHLO|nr:UDP-glucose 4-epimerase 3 [Tetrabaena socialis]|eukprot:PNH01867.1 UDP-glucose 4-epimerase 3 [Tetrabaena socialis]